MEIEVIEAAAKGDIDSFAALYNRYYSSMVAIAMSLLGDKHLAEDVAQETFAKAPPDAEARGMKTFFIQNGSQAFDVGYVGLVNSTVTVNDGQWHFVAVTIECATSRDNDTVTLYVDGSPAGAKDNWNINTFSEQDGFVLKIGNGTEATPEGDEQEADFAMINWNGMIDDVRIYSYALSADELAAVYESTMAIPVE